MKITTAAAVLHNMALDFADEMPVDNHPTYVELPEVEQLLVNQLNPRERRTQVVQVRDNWRREMYPSPTAKERRVMSSHRVQAEAPRRGRQ